MPTRMGGYLNALIFLMFLLSIGYSNNLLLIFTLVLFALNLLWVIQTHFFLKALKFDSVFVNDGHTGDDILVKLHWGNLPEGPYDWRIELETFDQAFPLKNMQNEHLKSEGSVQFPKRGIWDIEYVKIQTEKPFGLYRTWIFFPVRARAYAYPALLKETFDMTKTEGKREGEDGRESSGPHDVRNLAPYDTRESRRISWKHYARSEELLVKEGEDLMRPEVHFRLQGELKDKEYELSKFATQMVHCAKNDILFSLETYRKNLSLNSGPHHLALCLKELAEC